MADRLRRGAAEAFGTALLVAAVIGSGIMAERLTDDDALALLANSIATGAILVVLATILGPVSGAHLNPAVSLALFLRRELSGRDAATYAAAQVLGGIAGAALAHAMFDMPLLAASAHVRTGAGQWLSEVVAAFGLVFTILAGLRCRPSAAPALIGLYLVAAYWFTASTAFANPAVTIARTMTTSFAGIRPWDAPAFIAAQLAGSSLAVVFAGWLLRDAREI